MDTQVRTPLEVFTLPQHLVVPLFQRPYVWDEEEQWLPLWQDVERVANLRLSSPHSGGRHFLGAVVLQAHEGITGRVQTSNIIDGQQRLTTLQLFMDSVAAVLEEHGFDALGSQLQSLTHNSPVFVPDPHDQLKVRHTNRDRAAYDEVMNAEIPIAHSELKHAASKIVRAHAFFAAQTRDWLTAAQDESETLQRAEALATVLQQGLQLVVIDLQSTENSQEIFETLNARGTPLTAADLIKNFVFQRLGAEGADTQKIYAELWPFESRFWESDVAVGRNRMSRGSVFLNQWLVSRIADEVSPKQTFTIFKHYVEHETDQSMTQLLTTIRQQADLYEKWTLAAEDPFRTLTPVEMCVYRMKSAGLELLKPILLWLHEPERNLPPETISRVVAAVESWVMRRLLMRLSLSSLGRNVADIIRVHRSADPDTLASAVEEYLSRLKVVSTYWPGDIELRNALQTEAAYVRYSRGRLRMVLEAAEDHLRAPHNAGQMPRRGFPIEHLLPQKWQANWPVDGLAAELRRSEHVHRIGNLTLLTESLNSSVSNSAWLGAKGKRAKLRKYDVLLLNREILDMSADGWDEGLIDRRTGLIVDALISTWPVPEGHVGEVVDAVPDEESWVEVKHLVAAGLLKPGTVLVPRKGQWQEARATITEAGSILLDGEEFFSPSAAGRQLKGGFTNGWMFWHLEDGRRLADIREAFRGHRDDSDGGLAGWDPEADYEAATEFWLKLTDQAKQLFETLLEVAPEPLTATELAARLGASSDRGVAALLSWPGITARALGHRLPSRWSPGPPSCYWMDESAAELFSDVLKELPESEMELTAPKPHRTGIPAIQQTFWSRVRDYGEVRTELPFARTPRPQHWYTIPLTAAGVELNLLVNSVKNRVQVDFYIHENEQLFQHLLAQREVIENQLDMTLQWLPMPGRKACRIVAERAGDFTDESQAPDLIEWLVTTAEAFARVFPNYLR